MKGEYGGQQNSGVYTGYEGLEWERGCNHKCIWRTESALLPPDFFLFFLNSAGSLKIFAHGASIPNQSPLPLSQSLFFYTHPPFFSFFFPPLILFLNTAGSLKIFAHGASIDHQSEPLSPTTFTISHLFMEITYLKHQWLLVSLPLQQWYHPPQTHALVPHDL